MNVIKSTFKLRKAEMKTSVGYLRKLILERAVKGNI